MKTTVLGKICPTHNSLQADDWTSVNYEMPRSMHVHKSMLLRGVKFDPPALNREDIEATKGRASHSGRSFGGAPLGRGRGRGRGGQMNFADDRPNPFAAHINPGLGPPPSFGRGGPPPPPRGQSNGYPPPPRYNGPPPPGQNGYYTGPPPPQQGYGQYMPPPQPYPGGYPNGSPQGPPSAYGNASHGNRNGGNSHGLPQDSRYGGHNGYNR